MSTIVPIKNLPSPKSEALSKNWPNTQTTETAVCVAVNGIFELLTTSIQFSQAVNLPIRLFYGVGAFSQGDYLKTARHIIAFSTLFFPNSCLVEIGAAVGINFINNRLVAIGIDLIFEGANFYQSCIAKHPKNSESQRTGKLDPSKKEDALRILDLTEQEALDTAKLQEKYDRCINQLNQSKQKASPMIASELKGMIDDIHQAYTTLNRNYV